MRVAGGPRSSSRPLLLVLERALAVHKVHQQSKKNLPHCTPDARHATRRRGGRPVSRRGASSSRWEASGPGFRALAGSRRPHGDRRCQRSCRFAGFGLDCARGPHPGGRLFLFGQRVESRLRKTTRPGRALSGDREGSKGLPVDRKRPLGRFRWPGGKLLPGLGFTGARLARVLPRGVLGSNRNRG